VNILIVKLSSLGDILHNLPIVWDLRAAHPGAKIDWVVEEAYVGLLEPLKTTDAFKGIDRIISLGFRRWKQDLKKGEFIKSIQEFLEFKKNLQSVTYDLVIETQGLIKSAYVTRMANRTQDGAIFGLANQTEFSGYEPLARSFYTDSVQVPFHCHAVDRSRMVTAAALDIPLPDRMISPPQFYLETYAQELRTTQFNELKLNRDFGFDLSKPYVLCFHSTAKESKRWSNQNWIAIGNQLIQKGFQVILPWGNPKEKAVSDLLAKAIPGAIVPKAFSIADAFVIVAGAKLTIGVDTGLTHMSAILNKPTIELYCDSPRWKTEGYWSTNIQNLGDIGQPPALIEVSSAIDKLLNNPLLK
jgi:heptosyltransferase-1